MDAANHYANRASETIRSLSESSQLAVDVIHSKVLLATFYCYTWNFTKGFEWMKDSFLCGNALGWDKPDSSLDCNSLSTVVDRRLAWCNLLLLSAFVERPLSGSGISYPNN